MNRRGACLASMFLCTPFLLAMGLLGEPPPRETAPETAEQLAATLVDMEGVSTDVGSFSYDGDLYLPVYRGRALITVPFQRILAVQFGETKQNRRQARILFRSQEEEEFWVDERLLFLGKVAYGTFQVEAKDLQSIRFMGASAD